MARDKLNDEETKHALEAFEKLGLCSQLAEAAVQLGWKEPTAIQKQGIPYVLEGQDVIGLAQTGSGKTGAFALPILQQLMVKPQDLFALVLSPTRELAIQIAEQFEALGSGIGLKTSVLVGGIDMMAQAISLAKRPHVIVGTPGRVVDHLSNTKGFSLKSLKHLVLDEADKLLDMDFEEEIDQVLKVIPKERCTQLFSATMTNKVQKLQRACLVKPVKVEVAERGSTVGTLRQQYIFAPAKWKDCYLAFIINEFSGSTTMVFTRTCESTRKMAHMLRNLGFDAVPISGRMTQPKRLAAMNKFKSGERKILVATDVAARGIDVAGVDLVVNYDLPMNRDDYVHRVGRTARAGRSGRSITVATQYDLELLQRIEHLTKVKMEEFKAEREEVLLLLERVGDAQRLATLQLKEVTGEWKGKRDREDGGGEGADDGGRRVGKGRYVAGGGGKGGGRGGGSSKRRG